MYLLSWSYWFNSRPAPYTGWIQLVLIIFVLLLIAATVYTKLRANKKEVVYHRLWNKLFNFFLTNAILGVLLAFFNYQMVPILMAKAWFLVWGANMIVWLIFIIKFSKTLPLRKAKLDREKEFKKYLPK